MPKQSFESLRVTLREALYLDLDDFGLEIRDEDISSKFLGLSLHSVFQPVVDLQEQGRTIGYEALLRPSIGANDVVSPAFAFSFADSQGKLVKLDRVARTLHTLNYLNLPDNPGLLFLNVHPKLLTSINAHGKVFERILHDHSVPTHQVVIEILENAVEIDSKLKEAVGNYRDRGYKIAIDDFGSKHSNLDRLWDIAPDYVKFDISIIREAQANAKVRKALPKLIELVQALDAQAIIEGVENSTQYTIAKDSGATLVQGFHLGQPSPANTWRKDTENSLIRAAA